MTSCDLILLTFSTLGMLTAILILMLAIVYWRVMRNPKRGHLDADSNKSKG